MHNIGTTNQYYSILYSILVTAQGIGQKEQRKARTDEEQREESGERKPSPSDSLKGNSPLMPLEDRGQSGKDGKVLLAERLGEGKQLGKSACALRAAKSARNFVFEFCGFDGSLRTIVIWWHIRVS